MLLISVLWLSAALAPPVLMVREPSLAQDWRQEVTAKCGARRIRVFGYGISTISPAGAKILVDGASLKGSGVKEVLHGLSDKNAVYRIAIRCLPTQDFYVQFYRGRVVSEGKVDYQSATLTIHANTAVKSAGFHDVVRSNFWF